MRRIEKKKKKAGSDFPNTDVALSINGIVGRMQTECDVL